MINSLNDILEKYLRAFSLLKRGGTKYGLAPHKPVLLITLMELFNKGIISENKIFINADLVGTFKENWELLVPTLHQSDFTQPFYYLQNDKADGHPFWFIKPISGRSINAHIKSVYVLAEVCDHGFFTTDLFSLLSHQVYRNTLRSQLIRQYFPEQEIGFLNAKSNGSGYMRNAELYVLNEPEIRMNFIDKHIEEDVYVRSGLFKKLVPKIYDRTCCITGMRLESTFAHNFVDACHIIPFSVTQNDKVNNGIALCPNLHRAFDRGMVTIDDSYKVVVSDHLIEDGCHVYSLKKLSGKQISLPNDEQHCPSFESLEWHRNNIFKR